MCTVTLSYDQNNALARRKLAILMATGLFTKVRTDAEEAYAEDERAHHAEVEEFLYGSKMLAAKAFADRL